MNQHEKINYIEFPSKDLEKTKAFLYSLGNFRILGLTIPHFRIKV